MRFSIRSLLLATTVVAALCGLIFAAPLVVTLLGLSLLVWLSPSVWIAGLVFARGGKQAFFLGGIAAGAIPCAIVSYYAAVMYAEFMLEGAVGTLWVVGEGEFSLRLALAEAWLAPGVFAFAGGGLAWLTHRLVAAPQRETPQQRLESAEYRVVHGRLTTIAADDAPEPSP